VNNFLLDYTKSAYNQRGYSNVTYSVGKVLHRWLLTKPNAVEALHHWELTKANANNEAIHNAFCSGWLNNRNLLVVGRCISSTY